MKIRIKAIFQYSVSTAYDTTTTFTDDETIVGEHKIVDAPVTFSRKVGVWFWGNKTSSSFSSISLYGQESWADNDLQVENTPIVQVYVIINGVDNKVYDGRCHNIKYKGNGIHEFFLQDLREQFNKPVLNSNGVATNPVKDFVYPFACGSTINQVEPILNDFATDKYIIAENKPSGSMVINVSKASTNGDPLVVTTDYTVSDVTATTPSGTARGIDLTSPTGGTILTTDLSFTYSSGTYSNFEYVAWAFMNVYFGQVDADTPDVTDLSEPYISTKYGTDFSGVSIYVNDKSTTMRDVLDRMSNCANGFWYVDETAGVVFDTLRIPELETATIEFNESNIIGGKVTSEIDLAKNATFNLACGRNYRPLKDTELASSLTESQKLLYSDEYRYIMDVDDALALSGGSYPTILTKSDSTYQKKDKKDYFATDWQDTEACANQVIHLNDLLTTKTRRFYNYSAGMNYSSLKIGAVVKLNIDTINKNVIIIEISGDIRESEIKIKAWG